ncbi:hypothetical protein CEXT_567901 [Caerostris extrusa]|uniref:Uncharacterized protein n=1 Tax=Caerostris extrusa TaxID=172846 RepID=A0AAV4VZ11_CAEEX|nr:hypothetical protein CEXT_567901 [Caerostris extrusa]
MDSERLKSHWMYWCDRCLLVMSNMEYGKESTHFTMIPLANTGLYVIRHLLLFRESPPPEMCLLRRMKKRDPSDLPRRPGRKLFQFLGRI